jgi:hypothetical protein
VSAGLIVLAWGVLCGFIAGLLSRDYDVSPAWSISVMCTVALAPLIVAKLLR